PVPTSQGRAGSLPGKLGFHDHLEHARFLEVLDVTVRSRSVAQTRRADQGDEMGVLTGEKFERFLAVLAQQERQRSGKVNDGGILGPVSEPQAAHLLADILVDPVGGSQIQAKAVRPAPYT